MVIKSRPALHLDAGDAATDDHRGGPRTGSGRRGPIGRARRGRRSAVDDDTGPATRPPARQCNTIAVERR